MKKTATIAALLLLPLLTNSVLGDTVDVAAVADSTVDALQPDTSFPTGDLIAAKQGTPEAVATDLRFLYAQFDLPGGLTGDQILEVNDVQLRLSRSGPDLSLTYYVYGIGDGLDTASADSYTWNSGVGHFPENNLVKFLTPDEISYYMDPAESVFVGTLSTSAPGSGPYDFTSIGQSPTAAADLKNLILNDTDGRITFYAQVRQNFAVTPLNTFASLENGDLPPPALFIDFTPVPEPSACLLAIAGATSLLWLGCRHGRRTGKS